MEPLQENLTPTEITDTSRYLSQIDNEMTKYSITNGRALKFTPLKKITTTSNLESKIQKLFHYIGIIRFPLAGIALSMSLGTCLIKLAGHLFPSNLFCQGFFHTLSIASVGHYVLAAFVISALYKFVSLCIDAYVIRQSSNDCKVKYYNKVKCYNENVDHINKCFIYIEDHPQKIELGEKLFAYMLEYKKIFNELYNINTKCFVKTIQQQVEKILADDFNGEIANTEPNSTLISIYPEGNEVQDQETFACDSIQKAQLLISKINSYHTKVKDKQKTGLYETIVGNATSKGIVTTITTISVIGLHIAAIFVSLSPLFILGLSVATSILTLDLAINGHYGSKMNNEAINLHSNDLPEEIEAPSGSSLAEETEAPSVNSLAEEEPEEADAH